MALSDNDSVIGIRDWSLDCELRCLEKEADKGFTAIGISMDILYESLKDANEAWGRVRPFSRRCFTIQQSVRQTLESRLLSLSHVIFSFIPRV
jgi:hypothetical protein